MMIIEKLLGNISEIEVGDRRTDKVMMDHYDMTKPHQKVKSESGDVYAISLEQGESISAGAVLHMDDEKVVYIELLPEDCLVIRPEGNIEWARAAFNIGNMHQAAYVREDAILVAYDAIMESIIAKLGISCERCNCKLEGIRANVAQGEGHHHHHHDHDHAHSHGHSHGEHDYGGHHHHHE